MNLGWHLSLLRKAMLFFGIVGISLSLALGLFSIVEWEIVAVLVAVSLGTPSLILTYEKLTSEVRVKQKEERRDQKQETMTKEKEVFKDETIRASPDHAYYYEFELERDDILKGEISSTSHLDIYFVNKTNFKKWDKERDFNSECSNESVLKTKIDYEVPRSGTWYLLMENNGRKTAIVKVYLYLSDSDSSQKESRGVMRFY